MRIAVPYENGEVFGHFGRAEQFKIYHVVEGTIAESVVVATGGAGHGALTGFLKDKKINIVICGGVGEGAQNGLTQGGIKVYAGVNGDADRAVSDFILGRLAYSENSTCQGHTHAHTHTDSCGEHCGTHQ